MGFNPFKWRMPYLSIEMGFNPSTTKKQTTIIINRDVFQPIYKKTNNNNHSFPLPSMQLLFQPIYKKTNNNNHQ